MALTPEQKSDLLFKKIGADKSTSALSTAFFEELLTSRKAVLKSDIWTQSDQIPLTATVVPGVVSQVTDLVLQHIPGANSLAFYNPSLKDIIPFTYGDGSYLYQLKKNDNSAIAFGQNDWYLDVDAGVLTFFGGFPSGVSPLLPPKISCYKYIGTKGVFGGITGFTDIVNGNNVSTSFNVNHNFNSKNLFISIFDTSDVEVTDGIEVILGGMNDLSLNFNTPPSNLEYFNIKIIKI